jgi:hypothetical protein
LTVNLTDLAGIVIATQVANLTSSWQRFTVSGVAPATADRRLVASIGNAPSSAAKTVYAWGALLERASSATAYDAALHDPSGGFARTGLAVANPAGAKSLFVVGVPFQLNVALPGDWVRWGTSLHMVTRPANASSIFEAELNVFPRLRTSPPDNTPIQFLDAYGKFRLVGNQRSWSIDEAMTYGLDFELEEAL